MSRYTALKKTYSMCRRIKEQRGGSLARYFADAVHCSIRHGASPENYFVLRFFEKSEAERETYLTSGRSKEIDRALNVNAADEDKKHLGHKDVFNTAFRGLVRRDSVYAPDVDEAGFAAFISRHERFMQKPTTGTMGKGIEKRHRDDVPDIAAYYAFCRENKLLLEELIVQHPALEAVCPGCVNSVRINAARDRQGSAVLVGACLKCGGAGACTDNFHTGGVAYPLDIATGRVSGAGRNNVELKDFEHNPGSNVFMPGLQIPHWDKVIDCVKNAMALVPTIGYVGWDIAITPTGCELIEGNYSWPGGNIIQFDNIGKYKLVKDCLGEDYEHTHG